MSGVIQYCLDDQTQLKAYKKPVFHAIDINFRFTLGRSGVNQWSSMCLPYKYNGLNRHLQTMLDPVSVQFVVRDVHAAGLHCSPGLGLGQKVNPNLNPNC